MLTIHYSNSMECLLAELCGQLRQPLDDVLGAEPIVVQNTGMSRWLGLRLAEALGVAANLQFALPAGFIWQQFRCVLDELPAERGYSVSAMSWSLMAALDEPDIQQRFAPLQAYLAGGQGPGSNDKADQHGFEAHKQFELCARLAHCYDQYLVYRPDWIEAWSRGEDDSWQARLWRHLTSLTDAEHWVAVQRRVHDRLQSGDFDPRRLPPRVSVVAVTALSPGYLRALAALAEFTDMHLYQLNPCREYWGDIVDRRSVGRRAASNGGHTLYLETGNSLLATLGRQGRDLIDQLQEIPAQAEETWVEPEASYLLGLIQGDILHLNDRAGDVEQRETIAAGDQSLQIHVCHSCQREIEILHDQLLDRLSRNPDLLPSDILVMAPDIELYVPFIDAVFGSVSGTRRLSYSIADRSLENESLVVDAFFQALALSASRYEAERVMRLLEVPAVQARFGFEDGDLPLVRHWLQATGICWGVDAAARVREGLPDDAGHSWRSGLERLLLGYALPVEEAFTLYEGVLPWDDLEGEQARVAGQLSLFAEFLFSLQEGLATSVPVGEWVERLLALCDALLLPDQQHEADVQALRDAITQVADDARQGGYAAPVPLQLLVPELRRALRTRVGAVGFLSGGITFAAMAPLRSVPFKVVCFIGMKEGACPGLQFPFGFDLMAQAPRKGDRSTRDEDRMLFLEGLLAAREQVYISYIGLGIQDNSTLPPSVLVSELIDYLRANVSAADGADIVTQLRTEHPLQPFSRRYFDGSSASLFSYDQNLAEAAGAALEDGDPGAAFIPRRLPEADPDWCVVELDRLMRFFTQPARYLLQQRLGVFFEQEDSLLRRHEPFALGFPATADLRDALLAARLQGRDAQQLLPAFEAASWLPHGGLGRLDFAAEIEGVEAFADKLEAQMLPVDAAPLDLQLTLGNFQLQGGARGLTEQGFADYRFDDMRAWMWVRLWLGHLAWCCHAGPAATSSRWVARDKEVVLRAPERPRELLEALLEVYWRGLHEPLHFFPKSSLAFVEAEAGKGKLSPIAKARGRWASAYGTFTRPESSDPYYELLFGERDPIDDQFEALSRQFLRPRSRT